MKYMIPLKMAYWLPRDRELWKWTEMKYGRFKLKYNRDYNYYYIETYY